jgi:RNA-directed DNA polymerase
MTETSDSEEVYTRQRRIAQLARQMPGKALTSLNQHLDLTWLREAYGRTRKDGAAGVDGQTAADYEEDLEGNLRSLLERAKSGTYRAPPVRRVHIPKGTGGETRPIGIPTLEDKVLQRAVVMLLEPIYERDFYNCSYGFRPRRSAHDALNSLSKQTMWGGVSSILEVDIRKFFDTLDHGHLRAFLQQRIRDGVVLRLIGKWLNAGVMEDGVLTHPESGSPQGGVISPLLANVYLHYVLDEWFAREVQPRLKGHAYLVRYADDFVIGFTEDEDARRVMEVLPKRFGKYGLTIHPDKTRLVPFRKPEGDRRSPDDNSPGTFDFLGFTHFWARSRKGSWILKRKTTASRFTRAVRTIAQWCRFHRHDPVSEQHAALCRKLRGHYAMARG